MPKTGNKMKRQTIPQYRKEFKKSNADLSKMFGISKNHLTYLSSKNYSITINNKKTVAILASPKNVYKIKEKRNGKNTK